MYDVSLNQAVYGRICRALLRALKLDNASFSSIVCKGSITFLKWMEMCGLTYRVMELFSDFANL